MSRANFYPAEDIYKASFCCCVDYVSMAWLFERCLFRYQILGYIVAIIPIDDIASYQKNEKQREKLTGLCPQG